MRRSSSSSDEAGGATPVPARCGLCGRAAPLTRHHLIPRMRHRARHIRREYDRDELHGRLLWVCRACHDHIHAVLSEKELASDYNTRAALLAHPEIGKFVRWIAGKPPVFRPRSRNMRGRS